MPALLTDISSLGVGLKLDWPVRPAASFAVEWEDALILAEASYCVQDGEHYRVGLKINYIILDRTMPKPNRKYNFVITV